MVSIDSTRWPIEPHTQAKHLILRKYLDAWLPIMATYNGRIIFIDGFAGPGRYAGGEEGSPLIALRALVDHLHFRQPRRRREVLFLFSEHDEGRADTLNTEIRRFCAERPVPDWVKIPEVETGEFAPVMTRVLDTLDEEGNVLAPTFAFLDPFGFKDIPMALVASDCAQSALRVLDHVHVRMDQPFFRSPRPCNPSALRRVIRDR